ncbi:MAG: nicotinate-nicotinamide nucleotide adenylyltransferase [Holophagaceae bacterium]|nr:nicotinate-nicotinamide nucleotide adenylyltransferase [Holophagaceae bacterium]
MPNNPDFLKRRVGLLGGGFDPPHDGHLRLAQIAWENLTLDELRFVPAYFTPLKSQAVASPEMRCQMLQEMLSGTPFTIDKTELALGEISYTINTLETVSKREPGSAWILVIGSDQAILFESWRDNAQILEIASIAIAPRPNSAIPDIDYPALPDILSARIADKWTGIAGQVIMLPSTQIELASSQIRNQIANNTAPSGLSAQVKATITRLKIY